MGFKIISIVFLLVFAVNVLAQQSFNAPVLGNHPPITTDEVGSDIGIYYGRTLALASPDRRMRAYAELTAKSEDNSTVWALNISRDCGSTFSRIIVPPLDTKGLSGAEFRILGWSSDAVRLLAVMTAWAGDYTINRPVVLNASNNSLRVFDLDAILKRATKHKCDYLYVDPSGWLSTDALAFRVFNTEDLNPGDKPCFQDSVWSYNILRQTAVRLKPNAEIQSYGLISWADSRPSIWPQQGEGFNVMNPLCQKLLNKTVRFSSSSQPVTILWDRCSEGRNDDPLEKKDFPQHHVVVLEQGGTGPPKVLATVDNFTYGREEFYFDRVLITEFAGGQQVFISSRFYGPNEGHGWCLLDQIDGKYGCWNTPDLNAIAKRSIAADEDLCCADWSVSIQADGLDLERPVFDKTSGKLKRSLSLKLLPKQGNFEVRAMTEP